MAETTAYLDSYNEGGLLFRLVTHTTASPGVFLRKDHGLVAADRVRFDTDGTLPTGISANTWYFVIATGLTSDEFEIATTKGGSGVNITVAGTGQLFFATDRSRRLSVSQESTR